MLTILGYYLPTFSGYEEKLDLIILSRKAFLIPEDYFFYSHNLLFDESRVFSDEFVGV